MESPSKHIERMVGLPWVQASDDPVNGGVDCWGAVVYSYKCIDCITLPSATNRMACELDASAQSDMQDYYEVKPRTERSIFCCYDKDGSMVHIGRVLAGKAYHSVGTPDNPRKVCLWKLDYLEDLYNKQDGYVKYIQYRGYQ